MSARQFHSSLLRLVTAITSVLLAGSAPAFAGDALQLTLPHVIYAVQGLETGFYYDNIILTEKPEEYVFTVSCKIGKQSERAWLVTPGMQDVGDFPVTVTITDKAGEKISSGASILRVARADEGAGKKLRLLIVGDSLTAASRYPGKIGELLNADGNPAWKMFGNVSCGGPNISFEGYGGWTWQSFLTRYQKEPGKLPQERSSPFVFAEEGAAPKVDITRYVKDQMGDEAPHLVTFLLGINDCFGANPDDIASMDRSISNMFDNADKLLAEFRRGMPNASLAICVTTPPNARESGFDANYHGKFHRWGWKRIQHRLAQRQIEKFSGRENENVFLVPTELYIDPVAGYPENNGVHPNNHGYDQIGTSIFCWMKWWLKNQQ